MKRILLYLLFLCPLSAFADTVYWYMVTDTDINIKMSTVSYLLASDNDDTFYVVCKDGNVYGGVSKVTFAQLTEEAAGISEVKTQDSEVVISGNEITLLGINKGTSASIYGIDGKQVLSKSLSESDNSIYIGGLPSGVYVMKSGNTILKFRKK